MVVSPYEHDEHSTNSLQDKCRFSLSVMHSYPFDNFISYDLSIEIKLNIGRTIIIHAYRCVLIFKMLSLWHGSNVSQGKGDV